MERDRNLLFGIFAVQIRGVSPKQIVEAAAAWATDTSRPISLILVEQGAITPADVELIDRLVDATVQVNKGDASRALDVLGGEEQVNRTFCGSIVMRASGGFDTRPMASDSFLNLDRPVPVLSAVEEYPGRYSQVSEYGRGGMGRVLLVHDEHMGREVALKELLLPKSEWQGPGDSPAQESAAYMARFLQEARLTGKLEHPGIVPVYELGRRKDGTLYYTMKLVRGKTLAKSLKECKGLAERLGLLNNFIDICQAVAYAHSRGVIHRDIKPANVMVGTFGETIVLDWGLAKAKGVEDIQGKELETTIRNLRLKKVKHDPNATPFETRAGEAVGTPNYMSPEQAEGLISIVNERSDVYSLGVVLYELLTGHVPHEGQSVDEVLWSVTTKPPKPVTEWEKDAPPELVEVCMKCLRRDANTRYASAKDLAEDVRRFMTGAMVKAYSYSAPELFKLYYRRHRGLVLTSAAATAVLILVGVASYASIVQARNREHDQRLIAEAAQQAAEGARASESKAREKAERQTYLAQLRLAESHIQNQQMRLANEALDAAPQAHRDWVWGYLRNQAQPSLFTVRSEVSAFLWAKFDPAGKNIVGVRDAQPPGLWNAEDGRQLRDFEGQAAVYHAGNFSQDGRLFAAAGQDGGLDAWSVADGKQVLHAARPGTALGVAFTPDAQRVWVSFEDGRIVAWDLASGKEAQTIEAGGQPGTLQVVNGGLLIASNAGARKVQAWDMASGALRWEADGMYAWPSPDGSTLVAATETTVALLDSVTGGPINALDGHTVGVFHAAFSADGQRILTSSADRQVRLYERGNGTALRVWGLEEPAASAFFADGGARVVAVDGKNRYTVFDTASGVPLARFGGDNANFPYVEIAPDGRRLLSCSAFHSFQVFDAVSPKGILAQRIEPIKSANGIDFACAFAAARVAVLWSGEKVGVYSLPGLAPVAHFDVAPDTRSQVGITADGSRLLYWFDKTKPAIGDITAQKNAVVYSGHTTPLTCTALAADGAMAASADEGGELHLWNTASGETLQRIRLGTNARAAVFATAPARVAIACDDGKVRVYDVGTATLTQTIDAHASPVMALALQRSQTLLASTARDGSVAVWDFATGERRAAFPMEESYIPALANILALRFSEDDRYLITRMNSEISLTIDTLDFGIPLQRKEAEDAALLESGLLRVIPGGVVTFHDTGKTAKANSH